MFPLYYCHLPVYHTFVSLLCQHSFIVQEKNAKHISHCFYCILVNLCIIQYNYFFVIFLSLCIMYVCYIFVCTFYTIHTCYVIIISTTTHLHISTYINTTNDNCIIHGLNPKHYKYIELKLTYPRPPIIHRYPVSYKIGLPLNDNGHTARLAHGTYTDSKYA